MVWKVGLECHMGESRKIKWELVPYTRGRGLEIGCGNQKAFGHFIGVDNYYDQQAFGMKVNADVFANAMDLSIFGSDSMDFVFSSHVLEHLEDPYKALKEWWRVLKYDQHLCLYLPHKDLYPNIGTEGANPDHKHDFLPADIQNWMNRVGGWDLVRNDTRADGDEYSFFQVYKKLRGNRHHESWKKEKPTKTAGLIRYGAFGDLLQTSSVIKGLKDQGYHVTLYAQTPQHEVLLHDPHIDEIILQDKDQVPNGPELGEYWSYIAKKYDKFINLSESVEGTLLAMPGRTLHSWSPAARHKMMNFNYLEVQHDIAGVPHVPQVKFYSTPEEKAWARKLRSKWGDYVAMIPLAGSSVHKTWPYVDNVIAALMLHSPDTHVVFTGDDFCRILEAVWEKEERVHCYSGKLKIRETLALTEVVDAMVGPETGVMNAAAQLPIPKIVLLSHSTPENLTRDWVNTVALSADVLTCKGRGDNEAPACHQLHYSWDHCTKDIDPDCVQCKDKTCTKHTSTAACQAAIKPERVTDVLLPMIGKRKAA